jgi:hypothetical protein
MIRPVTGVWEDEISGGIIGEIISQLGIEVVLYPVSYIKRTHPNGVGSIRTNISKYNNAANYHPFLVMVDSDNVPCGPELIRKWGLTAINPGLLFQVAVREVESWVLSDSESFLSHFQIPISMITKFPSDTDLLPDPKNFLMEMISHSHKMNYKRRILPEKGSTARVGKDYNSSILEFIGRDWQIARAEKKSTSLKRFVKKLSNWR